MSEAFRTWRTLLIKTFPCLILVTLALILPCPSYAAPGATDNAANYAGLTDYVGSNRGSGYPSGFRRSGSFAGTFLGSSAQINTAGLAFGLQSPAGVDNTIARDFPSGSIGVGQIFQLQLQPSSVMTGGRFVLQLQNALQTTGTNASVGYNTANPNYYFTLSEFDINTGFTTRSFDTGVPFSTNALTIVFTPTSGAVTLSLTPFGGATTSLSATVVGVFGSFNLSSSNATIYFNNPSVVPEPGSSVILLAALAGVLCYFLVRRQTT